MLQSDLTGKVALVTGAGRGIGRACALTLADNGAEVIAVARTKSDLDDLAASSSGTVKGWVRDVTSPDFLTAVENLQQLDIVINNAGTNRPEPFTDVSADNLDYIMDLNVRSVFLAAQAAAKVMISAGNGGSIINMSSQMGHVGSPDRTVYCMTKHAIEGLTKAMAVELAPHKIRTNTLAPTFVETSLTKPMLKDAKFMEFLGRMIPLNRMATVDEIAAAALYLSSDSSAMVTGHSLKIDGGWTAQ